MSEKKDAVQKIDTKFLALGNQQSNVAGLIKANMGGRRIDPWSLDAATFPSGEMLQFQIPSLEGMEAVKEIIGVVVHFSDGRVYHEKEYGQGETTPPDCQSSDLINGVGNPGNHTKETVIKFMQLSGKEVNEGDSKSPFMRCDDCYNSEWGSARKGNGQACAERRQAFILREEDFLPLFMNIPPTSVKAMSDFFMRLSSKGKRYDAVVLKMSLVTSKNADGTKYAGLVVNYVRDLNQDEIKAVENYAGGLSNLFG